MVEETISVFSETSPSVYSFNRSRIFCFCRCSVCCGVAPAFLMTSRSISTIWVVVLQLEASDRAPFAWRGRMASACDLGFVQSSGRLSIPPNCFAAIERAIQLREHLAGDSLERIAMPACNRSFNSSVSIRLLTNCSRISSNDSANPRVSWVLFWQLVRSTPRCGQQPFGPTPSSAGRCRNRSARHPVQSAEAFFVSPNTRAHLLRRQGFG